MKQWLALLYAFLFSLPSMIGMGGVWVLELDFQYQGHRARGYVQADYWADDWDKLVRKDADFAAAFYLNFGTKGELCFYENLMDQEELANAVTFPMQPFILDLESAFNVFIQDIESMSLRKLWVKDDYDVHVLTDIQLTDTTWCNIPAVVTHPVEDDAGCRLDIYNYSGADLDPARVENLITHYIKHFSSDLEPELDSSFPTILDQFKREKVVVIELCGC